MRHVAAHGYPVPEVYDADGPDIVMQRIDGRTMLDDMGARPWSMTPMARMLAELIERLGQVPTPGHDLPLVGDRGDGGGSSALVHLDLHPGNVMLTAAGPVVIDWSNAAVGAAGLDAANTWLTLTAGQPEGSVLMRSVVAVGRRFFVHRFVTATDRGLATQQLPSALELRLRDPNQSAAELTAMRALVERVT